MSAGDISQRLNTLTGYETTEFTTDGSLHLRSKGQKFAVDFNKEQLETEAENEASMLLKQNEQSNQQSPSDDVENLYTTEMEEGEENDLKTRKSIIRSELQDGSINDENQEPLSYHINVGPIGHTYSFYSMQNIADDVAKSQETMDKYKA